MDSHNHNWTYDDISALHDALHNVLCANQGVYSASEIAIKIQGDNASTPFHLHVSRGDVRGCVWADVQMRQTGIYEISPRSQQVNNDVVDGTILTAARDQACEMLVEMLLHPEAVFAHATNSGSAAHPHNS